MERLVTLVGGSGFVGTKLTEQLARRGYRIRVLSRDVASANRLKPLGDLGQIGIITGDIRIAESLAPAVRGADIVINLVGILEGDAAAFEAMHVAGARNVALAAKAAGASCFIQMSALGADAGSSIPYTRSKAQGESAVLSIYPDAAIMRPSIIFGPEDNFTNRFAGLLAKTPVMPVVAPQAQLQPVYVGDVAAALAEIVDLQLAGGGSGIWELGGPDVFTLRELFSHVAKAAGQEKPLLDTPSSGARLLARASFLPGAPITSDQLDMLEAGNVTSGNFPGLGELGIVPTPLLSVMDSWLGRFRRGGRFTAFIG